ncbi:MAG: hypothetical protein QNK36_15180 [Colwellia sp.]|nr:hypothetical protein [Colwellia sp.]
MSLNYEFKMHHKCATAEQENVNYLLFSLLKTALEHINYRDDINHNYPCAHNFLNDSVLAELKVGIDLFILCCSNKIFKVRSETSKAGMTYTGDVYIQSYKTEYHLIDFVGQVETMNQHITSNITCDDIESITCNISNCITDYIETKKG